MTARNFIMARSRVGRRSEITRDRSQAAENVKNLMSFAKIIVSYLLGKLVDRQRFNDSPLYGLYLNVCYPTHARRKKAELRFYRGALAGLEARTVFDIGANGGQKAVVFLPLAEKIVCVEPSPAAVKLLKRRFAYNRNVVVVEAGVGAVEATAKFHMFGEGDCYNTFSSKWAAALASSSTEIADRSVDRAIRHSWIHQDRRGGLRNKRHQGADHDGFVAQLRVQSPGVPFRDFGMSFPLSHAVSRGTI
jgi:FkbM family methyltransferase